MTTVRLVGASGRVGAAIAAHLGRRCAVEPVDRLAGRPVEELARRAAQPGSIVVNAAGVAHLAEDDEASRERLRIGNVELPVALADAALSAGCSLVHISSVKAEVPEESAYAASKRAGDDALVELGPAFAAAGSSLVVIRPLALLFPPLDAGKVRHLRHLRVLPAALVPPVRLPVLSPATFLTAIEDAVAAIGGGTAAPGCTIRSFTDDERGTLRDVAAAFRA